jgi:hypothetical protein
VELEVYNYFGCRDTVEYVADFTTGILGTPQEMYAGSIEWEVWPNPARDMVHIRLGGKQPEAGSLRLFSMGAQEVPLEGRLQADGTLRTAGLPTGVYTMLYSTGGVSSVYKLVVME